MVAIAASILNCSTSEEDLQLIVPKTSLEIGESVQIQLVKRLGEDHSIDITNSITHPDTRYFTTRESALVYEPNGKITAIDLFDSVTATPIFWVIYKNLTAEQSIKVSKGKGPGPSLGVTASKNILNIREQSQLKVLKKDKEKSVRSSKASESQISPTWK